MHYKHPAFLHFGRGFGKKKRRSKASFFMLVFSMMMVTVSFCLMTISSTVITINIAAGADNSQRTSGVVT